jgi:hypothetical protein
VNVIELYHIYKIKHFRIIIMFSKESMLNYQTVNPKETYMSASPSTGSFKTDWKPESLKDSTNSQFNLRAHYQRLKESHPFYRDLYQPIQKPVQQTYLASAKLDGSLPELKLKPYF